MLGESVGSVPLERADAGTESRGLARVHLLLTVQTTVVLLLTVNRLSSLTLGYVAGNEFLRWVDFHNLLTLPLISLTAFYLLKRHLEQAAAPAASTAVAWLGYAFLMGTYLYGAGYGAHEVTNYLHVRFCAAPDAANDTLCRIVIFNDDEFSHWVWFGGFVLINAALLLLQAVAPLGRPRGADVALLIGNGLFIALGIFANLGFEEIGLDLYIVAALAALAFALLWRKGRRPLFIYYATAYGVGLLATAVVKLVM
jgi:hypothetical protein